MEIIDISVDTIKNNPNGVAMLAAYSEETRNKDLPMHDPDWSLYEKMEAAGMIKLFGAFSEAKFVGFIVVLMSPLLHYSKQVATVESFYVEPEFRSYGTGKKLLRKAEDYARSLGSPVLYVTAPRDGRLEAALPSFGYKPTNTLFCRRLSD